MQIRDIETSRRPAAKRKAGSDPKALQQKGLCGASGMFWLELPPRKHREKRALARGQAVIDMRSGCSVASAPRGSRGGFLDLYLDMPENIDYAVENRRADLATLTIGQLTLEYGREFRTPADIAAGKGELIERLLLKLQHELEDENG